MLVMFGIYKHIVVGVLYSVIMVANALFFIAGSDVNGTFFNTYMPWTRWKWTWVAYFNPIPKLSIFTSSTSATSSANLNPTPKLSISTSSTSTKSSTNASQPTPTSNTAPRITETLPSFPFKPLAGSVVPSRLPSEAYC